MLVQIRTQDLAGKSVQRPDVEDVGEVEVVLLESLTQVAFLETWTQHQGLATSTPNQAHSGNSEQFLGHCASHSSQVVGEYLKMTTQPKSVQLRINV